MKNIDKLKETTVLKKKLLPNLLFLCFMLIVIFAYIKKEQDFEIPVISDTDSQIIFMTGNIIEQTWQPNIKEVYNIKIPYISQTDFENDVKIEFLSDDRAEILADAVVRAAFKEGDSGTLEFFFNSLDVTLGMRYRIRMQFMNDTGEGSILLDANSNYGGCTINEIEQNGAIGVIITGVKTNRLSLLILSCFPFFSLAFLFMILFRRKWEDTIGLSFILITLLMAIAGMCSILKMSILLIFVLAILSFILAVWIYNRSDLQLKEMLSPGLLVFVALFVFVIINCSSLYVSRADEFTHWGLSVKDMYYYDSLTRHADSVVWHTYYPPFMPLIEYFFTYINGLYSDSIVYVGCQMMLISCLVISCKAADRKKKLILPAAVVILAVPLLFYVDIFSTLYADAALAVFIAYVLICYFSEDMSGFNLLRIVSGLAAITFTKPTGVVLAGLVALMMLGDSFLNMRKQQFRWKRLLIPCLCIILVCIFYVIWQGFLQLPLKADSLSLEVTGNVIQSASTKNITSASGITIKNIIEFLQMKSPEYRYDVLKIYLKKALLGDLFLIAGISFSYFELLFLVCLFAWLIDRVIIRTGQLLKFGVLSALAGSGYGVFLLVTYLFTFSQREAMLLAHIDRYLGSWICGVVFAFFILMLISISHETENHSDHARADVWIFLIMLLVFIAPMEKLVERRSDTVNMEEYAYGYDQTAVVARSFMSRGELIYFVGEVNNYNMFAYALCPMKVRHPEPKELSNWKEELKGYQYVFLLNADNKFKREYGEIFEESDKILAVSFYQVNMKNDEVSLKYIGTTEAMQFRQE